MNRGSFAKDRQLMKQHIKFNRMVTFILGNMSQSAGNFVCRHSRSWPRQSHSNITRPRTLLARQAAKKTLGALGVLFGPSQGTCLAFPLATPSWEVEGSGRKVKPFATLRPEIESDKAELLMTKSGKVVYDKANRYCHILTNICNRINKQIFNILLNKRWTNWRLLYIPLHGEKKVEAFLRCSWRTRGQGDVFRFSMQEVQGIV